MACFILMQCAFIGIFRCGQIIQLVGEGIAMYECKNIIQAQPLERYFSVEAQQFEQTLYVPVQLDNLNG